jgi:hypothetical protein
MLPRFCIFFFITKCVIKKICITKYSQGIFIINYNQFILNPVFPNSEMKTKKKSIDNEMKDITQRQNKKQVSNLYYVWVLWMFICEKKNLHDNKQLTENKKMITGEGKKRKKISD